MLGLSGQAGKRRHAPAHQAVVLGGAAPLVSVAVQLAAADVAVRVVGHLVLRSAVAMVWPASMMLFSMRVVADRTTAVRVAALAVMTKVKAVRITHRASASLRGMGGFSFDVGAGRADVVEAAVAVDVHLAGPLVMHADLAQYAAVRQVRRPDDAVDRCVLHGLGRPVGAVRRAVAVHAAIVAQVG